MSYRLQGQIFRFCFAKCVSLRRKEYLFAAQVHFGLLQTLRAACCRDEFLLTMANIPQGLFVSNTQ